MKINEVFIGYSIIIKMIHNIQGDYHMIRHTLHKYYRYCNVIKDILYIQFGFTLFKGILIYNLKDMKCISEDSSDHKSDILPHINYTYFHLKTTPINNKTWIN